MCVCVCMCMYVCVCNVGPPLTPVATCSLVTSAGGLNISLQWSSSFNSQHAVERYHVSVDPDPFSFCSSDQVMPSEDYSCPGLSPERNYSITVSAINCGDQEGESNTFTVLPQLLGMIPRHRFNMMSCFAKVFAMVGSLKRWQ